MKLLAIGVVALAAFTATATPAAVAVVVVSTLLLMVFLSRTMRALREAAEQSQGKYQCVFFVHGRYPVKEFETRSR